MKLDLLKSLLFDGESGEFVSSAELALEIARKLHDEGARAIIVGGTVRDLLLKNENKDFRLKDIDIEVFGIEKGRLNKILNDFGRTLEVGVSFAVFKLKGLDISLPRKDNKIGPGHKGFRVEIDPNLSYREASRRRSFTINSMGLDPLTGELLDPWGGQNDLKNRILKAVDPKTFIEDSLRILRGMQFAGRFELSIDAETLDLCRSISLNDLSEERIGEEWLKLLLFSDKPSIGLQAGMDMGIFGKLHPELSGLAGVTQQSEWHPEGDVWEHTKLSVDAMAQIFRREKQDAAQAEILMLAALLHDIGKPSTTELFEGFIHSYNHHIVGQEIAENFLLKIKRNRRVIQSVLPLIQEHLFLTFLPEPSEKALRRLSVRLEPATIRQLAYVIEAHLIGMKAGQERIDRCRRLLDDASKLELSESMPKPILTGKILINQGLQPGPAFGDILDDAYEAQLNNEFDSSEKALAWLKKRLKKV